MTASAPAPKQFDVAISFAAADEPLAIQQCVYLGEVNDEEA